MIRNQISFCFSVGPLDFMMGSFLHTAKQGCQLLLFKKSGPLGADPGGPFLELTLRFGPPVGQIDFVPSSIEGHHPAPSRTGYNLRDLSNSP